jgi:ribonuclease P/MRP protein subunit RPP40
LEAVDEGDVAILALFDLSAAFDTVDHAILLRRLQRSYGVDGGVLHWFESYLSGRRQSVRRDSKASIFTPVFCGIPQGSVLGPILFIIYTPDLLRIIERHGLLPHLFADDTQVYGRCSPSHMDELAARVSACTDEILSWMRSNRLQLNADKTELIWCATSRRLPLLPVVPIRVGSAIISPSSSVRDLGVHIDADLSMRTHVSRTTAGCFAALRQIRSVRRSLPTAAIQTLVVSLVLSRLDYGNASLAGIPANLLRRLQSVLNAAARTITGLPRSAHISTTLAGLHWLRAAERIKFKLATLMFRCLHGTAPRYLSSNFIRVADVPARRRLRSSSTNSLIVRQTRLVTVGDRAFPVAGANLWNSLPDDITSLDSLVTFRRQLKTYLFRISYPDFCC